MNTRRQRMIDSAIVHIFGIFCGDLKANSKLSGVIVALKKLSILFWQCLLLTASMVTYILPVLGKETANVTDKQPLLPQTAVNQVELSHEILNLSDMQSAFTSAAYLLKTPRNQNYVPKLSQAVTPVVLVTDVKVNTTNKGIEVILVTPNSVKLSVSVKTEGNSYVADIKNARLQLVSGESFRSRKPAVGIASVIVAPVDGNTLRLTVTGETAVPVVELFDSQTEGLVFGVTPTAITGQQPTPSQKIPPTESQQPQIELEVTAPPETGYNVPDASIGTRTNTPTRDVPQVINVIPQQVIKDQHNQYIGDALKNAGVSQGGFPSSLQDRFLIRGFDSSNNILTDGLRNYFGGSEQAINISNVEQIQVLRGPASVLYGQAGLGGIINVITKQPLKEPYYAASFSVGSFNSIQPSFDIGGPVTSDQKVLYRLNGSYLSSDSFVDFYHQQRYQIAGALSWDINKDTKLTLNSSYEDFNQNLDWRGLPAVGTVLPNPNGKLPPSRFLGEPGIEDPQDTTSTRLSYKLEHRFSENWSVENAFQAILTRVNDNPDLLPSRLEPDNRTLDRDTIAFRGPFVSNSYDLYTQVTGRFKTGSLEHQLIIGSEYAWINIHDAYSLPSTPAIDIFNPVYGKPLGSSIGDFQGGNKLDDLGVYAQDAIELFSNLKLVLGARYDWAGNTSFSQIPTLTSTSFSSEAFSPRVGLVYQPIKPISLYASYSRSFVPQTGLSANNNPFQPQRGTQYEVGVKAELLDDKLSANFALYDLTLTNRLTADPNNLRFSIPIGEERSRGVELFVTGEILPGLNVIASYGYTDPRVTKDNSTPVGNLINLAPQNQASLWTTYIIPRGNLKGIGAGLGLFYVGDRQGDLANSFKLPSYVRTDAALFYRRGQLDTALNFQNLFDITYFDTALTRTTVFYGNPFTVTFTLGWHF
ncbi:MAG: TonB-dependent siderophore receptor [Nostoc sp.]|uniref:TonB-dependent siderophore receptor n=1 Tax=Nostoc sp. TaxID=1180 RepID=UPI002FF7CD7C